VNKWRNILGNDNLRKQNQKNKTKKELEVTEENYLL